MNSSLFIELTQKLTGGSVRIWKTWGISSHPKAALTSETMGIQELKHLMAFNSASEDVSLVITSFWKFECY